MLSRLFKKGWWRFWDDSYRRAGSFLFFAGLFCGFIFLTSPKIKSLDDLARFSGILNSYSFREGFRGSHIYTIAIEGNPHEFKIPADFLPHFEKPRFENDFGHGQEITLLVPRASFENGKQTILVFGIFSNSHQYLNPASAIREWENRGLYLFIGFCSFGSILYFGRLIYIYPFPITATSHRS